MKPIENYGVNQESGILTILVNEFRYYGEGQANQIPKTSVIFKTDPDILVSYISHVHNYGYPFIVSL